MLTCPCLALPSLIQTFSFEIHIVSALLGIHTRPSGFAERPTIRASGPPSNRVLGAHFLGPFGEIAREIQLWQTFPSGLQTPKTTFGILARTLVSLHNFADSFWIIYGTRWLHAIILFLPKASGADGGAG